MAPNTMQLEGWANPLPDYIVQAIADGRLEVKQAKGYQYLVGKVMNPQGTCIWFVG